MNEEQCNTPDRKHLGNTWLFPWSCTYFTSDLLKAWIRNCTYWGIYDISGVKFPTSRSLLPRTGDRAAWLTSAPICTLLSPVPALHPFRPLPLTSRWSQTSILLILLLPSSGHWVFCSQMNRRTRHPGNFIIRIERSLSTIFPPLFPHPFSAACMCAKCWIGLSEHFRKLWYKLKIKKKKTFHITYHFWLYSQSHKSKSFQNGERDQEGKKSLLLKVFVSGF